MKLIDILLLSASVGFFIIGIDQVMRGGNSVSENGGDVQNSSYWIFMLSVSFLLFYYYRKSQQKKHSQDEPPPRTESKKKKTQTFSKRKK